jgi:hypothetical protein
MSVTSSSGQGIFFIFFCFHLTYSPKDVLHFWRRILIKDIRRLGKFNNCGVKKKKNKNKAAGRNP